MMNMGGLWVNGESNYCNSRPSPSNMNVREQQSYRIVKTVEKRLLIRYWLFFCANGYNVTGSVSRSAAAHRSQGWGPPLPTHWGSLTVKT